jgi:uncharacterized SAM-binding protein YcdF (DUF218 family)
MFFYLSKILLFLIKPFNLIVLALVLSFITKSTWWKKRLRILGFIMLLIFTNGFIQNELLLLWEIKPIPLDQINEKYRVGIVLGGTADSERAPNDRLFFSRGAERITHAVNLYKAGIIDKILFTGGKGYIFEGPEIDNTPIFDFYIMCGVDSSDILVESTSRNTHQNAVHVRRILEDEDLFAGKHVLLTSAYHMRRSEGCFEKEGFEVLAFSTEMNTALPQYRYNYGLFIPSVAVLENWEFIIKEWIGYIVYWIVGYI